MPSRVSYGPKRPQGRKGRNVKILEMIAFSIGVMAFSVGLLIFMMGGLKYQGDVRSKGKPSH